MKWKINLYTSCPSIWIFSPSHYGMGAYQLEVVLLGDQKITKFQVPRIFAASVDRLSGAHERIWNSYWYSVYLLLPLCLGTIDDHFERPGK